jgi:hypothetical protein
MGMRGTNELPLYAVNPALRDGREPSGGQRIMGTMSGVMHSIGADCAERRLPWLPPLLHPNPIHQAHHRQ